MPRIVLSAEEGDEMAKSKPYMAEETAQKYDRYGTMLFRMCMVILGNRQDAEDAVQDTFAKYLKARPEFANSEHEKAWFPAGGGEPLPGQAPRRIFFGER
jgi:DNA-directed RNA polymerase specialized sigma24 family protein